MKRLKAALIGLSGPGAAYLRVLAADDQFELIAVGDTDRDAVKKAEAPPGAATYHDPRSLILEAARDGLEALFVAAEPFQAREHVELALSRGVPVFHKTPPARSAEEALRLADAADRAARLLIVERGWAFEPAMSRLRGMPALIGRPVNIHAEVRTDDQPTGWRADAAKAGGGVLLNGAYDALDLVVALGGPIRSVFAQCRRGAFPALAAKYDTEDAAHVSLMLSNGGIGSVTAIRGAPHASWRVTFDGTLGTVTLSGDELTTVAQGAASETVSLLEGTARSAAISAFGSAVRAGVRALPSTIRDHVATLTVIDAAHLSARTAVPEAPTVR